MNKSLFSLLLLSFLVFGVSLMVRAQSTTYPKTRSLLAKMETIHDYKILKMLFEDGEKRKSDLIKLLYDPEQKISLNAQIVLRYLSEDASITALEKWIDDRKKNNQGYWTAPIELLATTKYLTGNDEDLPKLVLAELYNDQKNCSANLIAFNKNTETALIEVVHGQVFTDGYHVVIRKENRKWRLISNSLVWQS